MIRGLQVVADCQAHEDKHCLTVLNSRDCQSHDARRQPQHIGSSSQRGVQQGDPLGPSLFALAIHPCVSEAARIAESRFLGELEYNSFFLDDGVIAGRSPAVQQILATLEERLLEIGLCIARHKTEVVPACTSVQNFSPHDFEGFAWVPDGNIKLLGAAIGSQSWCEALLKRPCCQRSESFGRHWSLPRRARRLHPPPLLQRLG